MVNAKVKRAFDELCFVIQEQATRDLSATNEGLARQGARQGMGGNFLVGLDKAAAEACEVSARRMFEALIEAHAAEPVEGADERDEELVALLGEKIDGLGHVLEAVRNGALDKWGEKLKFDWRSHLHAFPEALNHARMTYCARARLAAVGAAHRGSFAMHNTFNAPVANVQQGHNVVANVQQTVAAPTSAEALVALGELRRAIENASERDPAAALEALEVVHELELEAARDKPNRLKVSGLLQGASAVIKGIADVPKAIETLNAWGHALGSML